MVTETNTNKTHNVATGQPAIVADNHQILNPQNHVPHRAGSSRSHEATSSARVTQETYKRKSPSEDPDEKKKKKAATGTWSSPSFLDPHNHKSHVQIKTEIENNDDAKMIGQSSKCFCGICFDFKTDSDMFRGSTCNHPFCADCISRHVAAQINKNVVNVNCPDPNCCVELKPEHLQPILPKEVIVQWESALCESSIAGWQKTYCPFKNCSVLLVDDGGEVVTSAECPSCHRLFCAQCKVPWHAGMNCEEFKELKRGEEDGKLMEPANSKMWQRCPNCTMYVQKLGGCEHMTCRCGCNFCYVCGNDWKYGHTCDEPRST